MSGSGKNFGDDSSSEQGIEMVDIKSSVTDEKQEESSASDTTNISPEDSEPEDSEKDDPTKEINESDLLDILTDEIETTVNEPLPNKILGNSSAEGDLKRLFDELATAIKSLKDKYDSPAFTSFTPYNESKPTAITNPSLTTPKDKAVELINDLATNIGITKRLVLDEAVKQTQARPTIQAAIYLLREKLNVLQQVIPEKEQQAIAPINAAFGKLEAAVTKHFGISNTANKSEEKPASQPVARERSGFEKFRERASNAFDALATGLKETFGSPFGKSTSGQPTRTGLTWRLPPKINQKSRKASLKKPEKLRESSLENEERTDNDSLKLFNPEDTAPFERSSSNNTPVVDQAAARQNFMEELGILRARVIDLTEITKKGSPSPLNQSIMLAKEKCEALMVALAPNKSKNAKNASDRKPSVDSTSIRIAFLEFTTSIKAVQEKSEKGVSDKLGQALEKLIKQFNTLYPEKTKQKLQEHSSPEHSDDENITIPQQQKGPNKSQPNKTEEQVNVVNLSDSDSGNESDEGNHVTASDEDPNLNSSDTDDNDDDLASKSSQTNEQGQLPPTQPSLIAINDIPVKLNALKSKLPQNYPNRDETITVIDNLILALTKENPNPNNGTFLVFALDLFVRKLNQGEHKLLAEQVHHSIMQQISYARQQDALLLWAFVPEHNIDKNDTQETKKAKEQIQATLKKLAGRLHPHQPKLTKDEIQAYSKQLATNLVKLDVEYNENSNDKYKKAVTLLKEKFGIDLVAAQLEILESRNRQPTTNSDANSVSSTTSVQSHQEEPASSRLQRSPDPAITALDELFKITSRANIRPDKERLKALEGISLLRKAYEAGNNGLILKQYTNFINHVVPVIGPFGQAPRHIRTVESNIGTKFPHLAKQKTLIKLSEHALLQNLDTDAPNVRDAKSEARYYLRQFSEALDPSVASLEQKKIKTKGDLLAASLYLAIKDVEDSEFLRLLHQSKNILNEPDGFHFNLDGAIEKKSAIHALDTKVKSITVTNPHTPEGIKQKAAMLRARATLHYMYWFDIKPEPIEKLALDIKDAGVLLTHSSVTNAITIPTTFGDGTDTRTALSLETPETLAIYEKLQAQLLDIQALLPETYKVNQNIYKISQQLETFMRTNATAAERDEALVELAAHFHPLEYTLKQEGEERALSQLSTIKQEVYSKIKETYGLLPPTNNELRARATKTHIANSQEEKSYWYETYEGMTYTNGDPHDFYSLKRAKDATNALAIARHVHARMGSYKKMSKYYLAQFELADGLSTLTKEELQKNRQTCATMKAQLEAYLAAAKAEQGKLGDKGRYLIRNSSQMTIEEGIKNAEQCIARLDRVLNVLGSKEKLTKSALAQVLNYAKHSEVVTGATATDLNTNINTKVTEFHETAIAPSDSSSESVSAYLSGLSDTSARPIDGTHAVVNQHVVNQYNIGILRDTALPEKLNIVTVQKLQDGRYISEIRKPTDANLKKTTKAADIFDLARDIVEEYVNRSDKVSINKSPRPGEKVWRGDPLELRGKHDKALLTAILVYCEQQQYDVMNRTKIDVSKKEMSEFAKQVEKDRPRQKTTALEEVEEAATATISTAVRGALTKEQLQKARNRPQAEVEKLTKEVTETPRLK